MRSYQVLTVEKFFLTVSRLQNPLLPSHWNILTTVCLAYTGSLRTRYYNTIQSVGTAVWNTLKHYSRKRFFLAVKTVWAGRTQSNTIFLVRVGRKMVNFGEV